LLIIRPYQPSDAGPTLALFRDTVQKINAKDYTADQIAVWAGHERSLAAWHASFMKHVALVALDETETIIGFADMASDGYLDRLYVSAAHQREGVGRLLVASLEQRVISQRYTAFVSITARQFFEAMGYVVVNQHTSIIGSVTFRNYLMAKHNRSERVKSPFKKSVSH
jgi:putative acetyltransferase